MSLTSPAHARNLQTNINANRYFFATQEAGEQELFLSTIGGGGPNGNISSLAVGISGPAGNAVVVSEGPSYMASEFISADQGAVFGSGSSYWTGSTITSTITGVSLSTDRAPGSGIACIEAYAGNGSFGGFEFLSRGVDSALLSTTSVGINEYISSLGRPGATAVLGASGTLITGTVDAAVIASVDVATTGGGRSCFNIIDLSGTTPLQRWGMGTVTAPTGGEKGSDFALYAYKDDGSFGLSPLQVQRSDGSMAIQNISSIVAAGGGTARGQVFPAVKDNTEFGLRQGQVISPILQVLFSTPVVNLNPNYQTMLNINWANSLSSGNASVNYKIGFSTSTAYTNIVQSSYVPGAGGTWTPSDVPGTNTPIGHTNICCILDSDGLDASGSGFLYVAGQLSDPLAPDDQIWITKGPVTEATRFALAYKTI